MSPRKMTSMRRLPPLRLRRRKGALHSVLLRLRRREGSDPDSGKVAWKSAKEESFAFIAEAAGPGPLLMSVTGLQNHTVKNLGSLRKKRPIVVGGAQAWFFSEEDPGRKEVQA